MRMIYQSEAAECGLACLAMIADGYGYKIDVPTLRRRISIPLSGVNLLQLMHIAESLGLAGRAVRLEPEALKNLRTPCVLHWDMHHFVVLSKASGSNVWIFDPSLGERKISIKEAAKSFTGVALEVTPTTDFRQKDERTSLKLSSFWSHIDGLVPALVKIFVLSLLLQAFVLAAPYYMQLVVDEVVVTGDRPLLIVLALGFGLIMLLRSVTEALRSWVILHLGSMLNLQMATNLFRHLLRLPLMFFEKRNMGDIVSRFGSLSYLRDVLANTFVETIIDGLMALLVLVMMLLYSVVLTLIVLAAVFLYFILRLIFYKPLNARTEASIVAQAKEQANFMETVRSMQGIKLFGIQGLRLSFWQNQFSDYINEYFRLGKWGISFQTANAVIFGIENIVVVYIAAIYILDAKLTLGMLFAYMAYKLVLTQRMTALINNLVELRMTRLHLERLSDIALTEPEPEESLGYGEKIRGDIAVDNVWFRYAQTEPYLFEGLSFHIGQGNNVAIVGASGCGKSSLVKLMLGLLRAEQGRVVVDGKDISDLGLRNFRQQVAAVMQDDQLMSGSITENITLFSTNVDMERVRYCAEMACVRVDIEQMNMGFDSLIGEMGSTLAGGQKQRLLLARALYREPKILFLDEATSHLDIDTEKKVSERIESLDITRIMVAHRPETIRSAKKVMLLEKDRLIDVTSKFKR